MTTGQARWVLHVDLDQFLAAVEVLRRPELAGLPVVVGGRGDPTERGVVSTASYEARAFGVHSGVPLRTAARRCPQAVFLPVDREAYEAVSAVVMATLRDVVPLVEVMGWDEAFLAVESDAPNDVARELQRRVLEATGLHCSVGIGQNKLQAKLATGFGKPAGVFTITDETWMSLLGGRPTDALWGIGSKTARRLREFGITTVEALATADRAELAAAFGPSTGPSLIDMGNGRASARVVGTPYVPRSRSREVTFQRDLADWADVRREVAAVARQVADDIVEDERPVVRVVVKVRHVPFFTSTHGRRLQPPSSDPGALEQAALEALEAFDDSRAVRLLGVRAEFGQPADRL